MKTEDWEYEAKKDLLYVHEDMYEFYQLLNNYDKPPATIIVKKKRKKSRNHEHKVNNFSF